MSRLRRACDSLAAEHLDVRLLLVLDDDERHFPSLLLIHHFEPRLPLLRGLAFVDDAGEQKVRDEVNLRVAPKSLRVFLNQPVKGAEEPRVILDVDAERRVVGIGLGNGLVAVFRRPGLPERLPTLLVLIRDVVGFGIFEDEPVEPDVQNPRGHGSSDLFVAEAQDRIA